jgi:arginine N-succinyltransferase
MLTVRPARHSDLEALVGLAAQASAPDLTLPADAGMIERLIVHSEEALEAEIEFPGEERYLLVATDNVDAPIGALLLVAAAGYPGADYSYRNDTIVHAAPELGVNHRLYVLALSHDLSGLTRLTPPLVVREALRTPVGALLLKAALCFVAEHPQRFADELIAPLPGLIGDDGQSPFWQAVGSKFFGIPIAEAERRALGKDRSFMAELMPHHPLYVPLLPEAAQSALGQTRPAFMPTYGQLIEEGFEAERYVDVFDGGPTFYARREVVTTIRASLVLPLAVDPQVGRGEPECLLCNREAARFRAVLGPAARRTDGAVATTAAVAARLELIDHDEVRCVFA